MRLLFLNYEYPPIGAGAGNATREICRRLASWGHEVLVLTALHRTTPAEERDGSLLVVRVPAWRRRLDRSTTLEKVAYLVSSLLHVPRLVRSLRPDCVIAFFGYPGGPTGYLASLLGKCPYVLSLRGGDIPGFMEDSTAAYHDFLLPLTRLLWARASALVVTNSFMQSLALATAGPLGKRVSIIPNGVDCRQFQPCPRTGDPQLLYVGRVVRWQKGLELLVAAVRRLREEKRRFSLAIVGDGEYRVSLAAEVESQGLAEVIRFPGWIAREALPDLYRASHVFVLPTLKDGMTNSLLEAMASGLPVVTTDCTAVGLVRDGIEGRLLTPGDGKSLEDVLRTLLDDAEERERLGRAARACAESMDWNRVAGAYLSIAQEAVLANGR